ncbi:hypothetical protein STRDD11_01929 [Streptococcus sp. DD11]|nr:hypothetical protein STRDD11_01929 [Streptococcus sp. DD11]
MSDPRNIQTAGSHIRCHQDIQTAIFKITENPEALALIEVAMDAFCPETAKLETAGQLIHPALGPAKDDRQLWLVHIHEPGHGVKFFIFLDTDIILIHQLSRQLFGCNLDMVRILHKLDSNTLDSIRHSSRKEQGLALLRNAGNNGLNIFQKAHIKHFIGLIQDQGFHMIELEGLALDQIQKTARCPDDDMGTGLESLDLLFDAGAAINRADLDTLAAAEAEEFFLTLHSQLPRRGNNQSLHRRIVRVNLFQSREAKGRSLTGPGLSLTNHVLAGHSQRNGLLLDRAGLYKAGFVNLCQQFS